MFLKIQSFSVKKRLTCQTKSGLVTTFRAQADLIDELIDDKHKFVRNARFQSNPIERRFSQYQQMSGGNFLVSLREVLNSERILSSWSLIKENVNFWEENIDTDVEGFLDSWCQFHNLFDERTGEIMEAILDDDTRKVVTTISGYVSKNLI